MTGPVGLRPRSGRLYGAFLSSASLLARAGSNALVALVVARDLGAAAFGGFAAALAVCGIASALSEYGAPQRLTMTAAQREGVAGRDAGRALTVALRGAAIATVPVVGVCAFGFDGVSISTALLLVVSEIWLMSLVDVAASAAIGTNRMGWALVTIASQGVARVICVYVAVVVIDTQAIVGVAIALLAAAVIAGIVAGTCIVRLCRLDRGSTLDVVPRLNNGWQYVAGLATGKALADGDKVVLSASAGNTATAVYTVAYRAVDIAMIPVYGLITASMPRLYRSGASGTRAVDANVRRIAPPALLVSGILAVGLVVSSSALAGVFGDQFSDSGPLIASMAGLPLIRVGNLLLGEALTSVTRQNLRLMAWGGGLIVNLGVLIALGGSSGASGAVVANYCGEATVLAFLWRSHRRTFGSEQRCEP